MDRLYFAEGSLPLDRLDPGKVSRKVKAFGEKTRGWTARTSQSIFGGNGWEWNIPAKYYF